MAEIIRQCWKQSQALGGSDEMRYDNAGNLLEAGEAPGGGPAWEIQYDGMDMQRRFISSVAPSSDTLYAYDSRDYRLVTFDTYAGELTYQFRDLGGRVLRESKVTAAIAGPVSNWERWEHQKDYVYGPEGLLATVAHDGTPHFFHKDHLGTPRAITDRFGALSGRHDYYPFGEEADNTPLYDDLTVKFTGHQRDLHGLSDYMMGRTCLWPLRRFASVDKGRDGWNMYAYTRNNPVKYVDPDGERIKIADGDVQISEYLALTAMRPSGRAMMKAIAEDKDFTWNLSNAKITSRGRISFDIKNGLQSEITFGQGIPDTETKGGQLKFIGINTEIDTDAIDKYHFRFIRCYDDCARNETCK